MMHELRHRSLLLENALPSADAGKATAKRRAARLLAHQQLAGARRLSRRERRALGLRHPTLTPAFQAPSQLPASNGTAGTTARPSHIVVFAADDETQCDERPSAASPTVDVAADEDVPCELYREFGVLRNAWSEHARQLIARCKKTVTVDNAAGPSSAPLMPSTSAVETALANCDLHGSTLRIARSATRPALLGVRGTVLQETHNTFRLLTQRGKLVTVPKKRHAFMLDLHPWSVTLHGDQLIGLRA
jgi:RNase P/RNase MRP subunit p29